MCIVQKRTVYHEDGTYEEEIYIQPCSKGSEVLECKNARHVSLPDVFPPTPAHSRNSSRNMAIAPNVIEIEPAIQHDDVAASPKSPKKRSDKFRLELNIHIPFTSRGDGGKGKDKDRGSISRHTPPSTPSSTRRGTVYSVERRKHRLSPVQAVQQEGYGGIPPPPPPTPPRPKDYYYSDRSMSSRNSSIHPDQYRRRRSSLAPEVHRDDLLAEQRQREDEIAKEQRRRRQSQIEQLAQQEAEERARKEQERIDRMYKDLRAAQEAHAAEQKAAARQAELERLNARIAELKAQLPLRHRSISSRRQIAVANNDDDDYDSADDSHHRRRRRQEQQQLLPRLTTNKTTKKKPQEVVIHQQQLQQHPEAPKRRTSTRIASKPPTPSRSGSIRSPQVPQTPTLEERGDRAIARAVAEHRDGLAAEKERNERERDGPPRPRMRGGDGGQFSRAAIMPDSGEGRAADLLSQVFGGRDSRREEDRGLEKEREKVKVRFVKKR